MITETNTDFTITVNGIKTSDKPVTHFCKAEFTTADSTMAAIVSRIETKIRYLSCYGRTIKGMTTTDAINTAEEIRGMIKALECVCDSVTLTNHLLDNRGDALVEAFFHLRLLDNRAAARSEAADHLRK